MHDAGISFNTVFEALGVSDLPQRWGTGQGSLPQGFWGGVGWERGSAVLGRAAEVGALGWGVQGSPRRVCTQAAQPGPPPAVLLALPASRSVQEAPLHLTQPLQGSGASVFGRTRPGCRQVLTLCQPQPDCWALQACVTCGGPYPHLLGSAEGDTGSPLSTQWSVPRVLGSCDHHVLLACGLSSLACAPGD